MTHNASQLISLQSTLANLQGQSDMLRQHVNQTREEVAQAKQRESLQPAITHALDLLQKQEHERSVGVFSRLLTALAKDVLPNATKPIVLDLYTAHGAPALDIDIAATGKFKEEITSGAIKNVLSVGLRLISIARTKQRRFLVLDEPDHWIKPENVPQFVSVLDKIIRELGFQILMISHHPASYFAEVAKCVSLEKQSNGLVVSGDLNVKPHTGLKAVHLMHFESHTDTYIPLHEGMTILTGDNNIGKSSFIRGLKALLMGEMNQDRSIQHEPTEASWSRVELQLENGEWIGLRRARKLNQTMRHKNRFYVRTDDSPPDDESRFLFAEDSSDAVPDFIQSRSNIRTDSKWAIHIAGQEESVFLLNQTTKATERAKILALGNEAEVLHAMIERNRANSRKDKDTIREGEKKLGHMEPKLKAASEMLTALSDRHQRLSMASTHLTQVDQTIHTLKDTLRRAKHTQEAKNRAAFELSVLEQLPSSYQLPLNETQDLQDLLTGLKWVNRWAHIELPTTAPTAPALQDDSYLRFLIYRISHLASIASVALPKVPNYPVLQETALMDSHINQLRQQSRFLDETRNQLHTLQQEYTAHEALMTNAWDDLPQCPLCNQTVPHHSH
jgi:predicted ATPase